MKKIFLLTTLLVFLFPVFIYSQIKETKSFFQPKHEVVCIAFSNDGQYIVTGGLDKKIVIWNAERKVPIKELTGLSDFPLTVAITSDNKYIVSAGKDNNISIWDFQNGRIIKTYQGHKNDINSIDISNDNKYIVSASKDKTVIIWDFQSGKKLQILKGHSKGVTSVDFNNNGKKIISGSADGTIKEWDVKTGNLIQSINAHKGWVRCVKYSPNDEFFASCGDDSNTNIWDANNGILYNLFSNHSNWVQTIEFSPNGEYIASGGHDNYVFLTKINNGEVVFKSEENKDYILSIKFNPNGRELIFSSLFSEKLTVIDISSLNIQQEPVPLEQDIIDKKPPIITITYPNVSRGFKPVLQENQISITGKITDTSGIFEILVNGEPASVDAQGNFSKTVLLAFGDNSFTIKATDIKQNSATETFVIERKSNQQDVVVNNQINNSQNLQTGKYYALIIGNNDYQAPEINSLDEPINDATKLYNVLTTDYTFEPQNVTFLKNASYVQMIEAFDNLSNTLTENDNLLVFYAGHGWWDDDKNLGYWLPTDARKNNTAFWIGNSRIRDYMSSIKSKHTLLIADACFSGSIFKTRSAFADAGQGINSLYELPSRTAMTSGNLKEVPDKSVFLEYLVKRLSQNPEKYLSADQLFVSFRLAVMNNSKTEPQFGTIQDTGDEGGEFIFIHRDN